MAEVTNELVYEVLNRVQQDVADVKQAQRDHTAELLSVRRHLAATDIKIAAVEHDLNDIRDVAHRVDQRLARVERRLDIIDAPVA